MEDSIRAKMGLFSSNSIGKLTDILVWICEEKAALAYHISKLSAKDSRSWVKVKPVGGKPTFFPLKRVNQVRPKSFCLVQVSILYRFSHEFLQKHYSKFDSNFLCL